MISRRLQAIGVATALGLTLAANWTQQTMADGTQTLPLHNDRASEYESGEDQCENLDPESSYWHFVIAPNNNTFAFVSMSLNLGDIDPHVVSGAAIIPNGGQADNVFVEVPAGETVESLVAAGSTADITPPGAKKFVLSHVCVGEPDGGPVENLSVTKDIHTAYDRQHYWSLDKSVRDSELLLYTDGSGDGSVTWTIDVSYDESNDVGHAIWGTVWVTNVGGVTTVVEAITDTITIDGVPQELILECDDDDFVIDVGEVITCTYSVGVGGEVVASNVATATTVLNPAGYVSDAVDAVWGDPANEYDKSVTVTDVSDLDPDPIATPPLPASFTAPTGGAITYSNDFAWEDYGNAECGNHTYDNTATLTSDDDDEVLDSDSESVTVKVQCLIFDGETAWAANGDVPGELKYNNKRGNWATYVEYAAKTTTVFAGQTIDVGSANFSAPGAGGMVTITVTLDEPWEYAEGPAANLKVQGYSTAPSGNPSPGSFANKKTCDPVANACSITVPGAAYYGVHVDVGQWVPDPGFPYP